MSPSGDIFPSIRTALVHMVSSKFSEDDISIMRKALVNQKLWLSHPDLPHNWMYQRTNNNILYCDPNGQKHGSKDMALKSLNNPDVIAKLTYFKPPPIPNGSESFDASWKEDNEQERPKVNQEQKQANMEDWKSDELLYPNGWKYKEISRLGKVSHTLLSPSGVRLPNPRAALVFMTKNNFPELDIAIMREALVTQNIWSTHPALPDNWLYRRVGQYNVEYCDPKGRSYRSKDIALNAHALDSKEVIQKLRLFNPPIPLHELNFDESWNIDENVYPAGWRYKDVVMNGRTMFERIVSNDGVVFKGKRAALAYMIKNNFANEDKQKLSFSLEKDGWFSHQSLPEHWLLKKTREGPTFSNENGIKMKNLNAAVKYLAKAGLTSFIENLKDFERPRESKSSNPTQTFKGETKNIVNDDESWKIDEHVYPTGWKYKDVVINGRKMYERIVSHNGVVFKGKRAALAFMIKNSFTNEDQEKLYFSLEQDGWFSHQSLPEHWLFKRTSKGPMFSNENGIKLKNLNAAVEYLARVGLTSFIENLKDFEKPREFKSSNPSLTLEEDTKNKVNDDESWNIDENVYPTGWKYKDVMINGRKMYERIVSRDGVVFKGKRAALAFMIKNNFAKEDNEKLSLSLEKDGWFSHQSLPEHWLYKKTSKGPMFSNENGIKLKNLNAAVEYASKIGLTSYIENLKDFENPRKFQSSNPSTSFEGRKEKKNKVNDDQSWKIDETIYPTGWKYMPMKVCLSGPTAKIKSSTGDVFRGKRAAMEFMIKNNYAQKDVEKIRQSLESDGWSSDLSLPPKWLYKRNPGQNNRLQFISENGVLLKRSDAINHFHKLGDSRYSQIFKDFTTN